MRELTISYVTPNGGTHYVPFIRLQGKWLSDLGFQIGKKVIVQESKNEIVIRVKE